jgi:hypothetical protein
VAGGDVALIWLGTNNNKGGKTPWVQGLRAIGRIEKVLGDEAYGAEKTLVISIGVVLPESITKMDLVVRQSARYPDIAAMPVLGVNNYSSQVVQRVDPDQPGQRIGVLFAALGEMLPRFSRILRSTYPDVHALSAAQPWKGTVPDRASSSVKTKPLGDSRQEAVQRQMSLVAADESDGEGGKDEDDDGLERDDERGSEIEVPFDPTKIDIVAKPMTISSLEDRLDNGELDLTPDFQRQANVWDAKRKARLIESILLKIPLPSFYFSEDLEGGYAVVDGLQRLCAVFHFKNVPLLNSATGAALGPLRLKGLQYLKELEGRSFAEMDRKFQRRISELEITTNVIRANTPSAVKFNVFARLNQGGMPLNAQEIRNAIFPGEWRNELRRLAEGKSFIKATDGKVRTTRQQDMELMLRFVALWSVGGPYKRPQNQTLDEFLNGVVEGVLLRWSADHWAQASDAFGRAVEATFRVRGRHAFRKSFGKQQRKPVNRGLFEAELIVFGSLNEKVLSQLEKRSESFNDRFGRSLVEDRDFSRSLLYATGSGDASNIRISFLQKLVKDAANA